VQHALEGQERGIHVVKPAAGDPVGLVREGTTPSRPRIPHAPSAPPPPPGICAATTTMWHCRGQVHHDV